MKSVENRKFAHDFKGTRSLLICLILELKFGGDPLLKRSVKKMHFQVKGLRLCR